MTAAGDPVELPPESEEVDYEGELAVIIGRAGRRIKIEDALGHVAGVSIANDITMRDYQRRSHQWLQGKAWDACIPLGPELVTLDEVSDPKFTMVEPGDVILIGTPGGVGARRDPPVLHNLETSCASRSQRSGSGDPDHGCALIDDGSLADQ